MFFTRVGTALSVIVASLAGCSSPEDPAAAGVSEAFRGQVADFDVYDRPEDLARIADAVVVGHVVGVADGRYRADSLDDPSGFRAQVLTIEVDQTYESDHPADRVYVEVTPSVNDTQDSLDAVMPKRDPMVFYLSDISDASGIADPSAGRPDGQPMYTPVSPQGWIIYDQSAGTAVLPLAQLEAKVADLALFVPGSRAEFPVVAGDE